MLIQDRDKAIYAMSQGGMLHKHIAERFKLSQTRIFQIVKAESIRAKQVKKTKGINDRERLKKIREADMNYIRVAYKNGLTVTQMASALREPTWKVEGYLSQVQ